MTSHKRKASQELGRLLVPEMPTPARMNFLSATLSTIRDIWRIVVATNLTTSVNTPQNLVEDTHKEIHEQRNDGLISVKRQMINRITPVETLPAANCQKIRQGGGRGQLDYKDCKTEEDFQRRNEDFWAPAHSVLDRPKKQPTYKPMTPPQSRASSVDDQGGHGNSERRLSRESISPRTPRSTRSLNSLHRTTFAQAPQTTMSVPGSVAQSPESIDERNITKQLEDLFVTSGQDLERSRLQTRLFEKKAEEDAAKKKEADLFAAKQRRLTRRRPLIPLVHILDQSWTERVRAAALERDISKVLINGAKGTDITAKDFRSLLTPRSWLNDEIINGYLEWIEDAANNAAFAEAKAAGERMSEVPRFLVHNSFFFNQVRDKGPRSTERLMKRRKVAGKSFLQVDTMFVPICKGNHWTLGIVRPLTKTIEYFDSFGGSGVDFIKLMRGWLAVQLGDDYKEDEWGIPRTSCAVQSNGYDCGVFVCTNALCVAVGLSTACYKESDMSQQRQNVAAVLLNKGFVGDFEWGKSGL